MIQIEIDGQQVEVPAGSTVMDAAAKLGLYVPHFCYHKKLSIAANCRMCLVEVEKAPKPLPACATPVSAGMKVSVTSEKARIAQKGVMEFLLVNHPLDCPICDQGGECQLQDLAVGYGPDVSRYQEEKRIVFHKPMGPLVSAEEMSRCIHCTRCVRFGQEIAGVMELGMAGRGEHSEIMTFVGEAVESELSGNMIDICPVGALTSKPFRYKARTWELTRRPSISLHDGLGANLVVQTKSSRVLRVVPKDNDAVNECWISDRDRFAYEGLHTSDRLLSPMVREANGVWREASWEEALARAAEILRATAGQGADKLRALASPLSTLEEMGLMARLARGLGSESIDSRPWLRESGFDLGRRGIPGLGMEEASVSKVRRALVVGSTLRQEIPLIAQRLRHAARTGAQVATLHAFAEELLMPVSEQLVASPGDWRMALDQLHQLATGQAASSSPLDLQRAQAVLDLLRRPEGAPLEEGVIFAGADILSHPEASVLLSQLQALAEVLGCHLAVLSPGGNAVGAYVASAIPGMGGRSAAEFFDDAQAAFLLMNLEPALDCAQPQKAVAALRTSARQPAGATSGQGVVALTAYRSAVEDVATVMLPVVPFTETSGSMVNLAGRLQTFPAACSPMGQARPAWKVLRVLGNLLDLEGFEAASSDEVRESILPGASAGQRIAGVSGSFAGRMLPAGQSASLASSQLSVLRTSLMGVSDPIVRRAAALSATRAVSRPLAVLSPADVVRLGLDPSQLPAGLRIRLGGAHGPLVWLAVDSSQVNGVVRIPFGHPALLGLDAADSVELSVVLPGALGETTPAIPAEEGLSHV